MLGGGGVGGGHVRVCVCVCVFAQSALDIAMCSLLPWSRCRQWASHFAACNVCCTHAKCSHSIASEPASQHTRAHLAHYMHSQCCPEIVLSDFGIDYRARSLNRGTFIGLPDCRTRCAVGSMRLSERTRTKPRHYSRDVCVCDLVFSSRWFLFLPTE